MHAYRDVNSPRKRSSLHDLTTHQWKSRASSCGKRYPWWSVLYVFGSMRSCHTAAEDEALAISHGLPCLHGRKMWRHWRGSPQLLTARRTGSKDSEGPLAERHEYDCRRITNAQGPQLTKQGVDDLPRLARPRTMAIRMDRVSFALSLAVIAARRYSWF